MIRTKDWVLLTAICFTSLVSANEVAKLTSVTHQTSEDAAFQTVLTFDGEVSREDVTVEFINQTIQVDVANATMTKARDHQKFSDSKQLVKSLYTYRPSGNVVRHRLILNNDQSADAFKEQIEVSKMGNQMIVTIKNTQVVDKILQTALPPRSLDSPPVIASNSDMEPSLQAAAKTTENATDTKPESTLLEKKAEEATPLFKSVTKASGKPEALWMRLLVSIAVLITAASGLVLFAKWWNRNHKRNPMAGKIEVVSQFHLGPKRSLAIIRVAGEFILIGMTDHNISMIKTLSLIDDEFEQQLSKLDVGGSGDSLAKLFGKRSNDMESLL